LAPCHADIGPQGQGQAAPPAQPESQTPVRHPDFDWRTTRRASGGSPIFIAPYQATIVPSRFSPTRPVSSDDSGRQLRISLQDAIDLALQKQSGTSRSQRYKTPWLAEANILRTMGRRVSRTLTALGNIPAQNFDPW